MYPKREDNRKWTKKFNAFKTDKSVSQSIFFSFIYVMLRQIFINFLHICIKFVKDVAVDVIIVDSNFQNN